MFRYEEENNEHINRVPLLGAARAAKAEKSQSKPWGSRAFLRTGASKPPARGTSHKLPHKPKKNTKRQTPISFNAQEPPRPATANPSMGASLTWDREVTKQLTGQQKESSLWSDMEASECIAVPITEFRCRVPG